MKDFVSRGHDPRKNLNNLDHNQSEGNKSVVAMKKSKAPTKSNSAVQAKEKDEEKPEVQMKADPLASFYAFKDAQQNTSGNNVAQAKERDEDEHLQLKKDEDEELLQGKGLEEEEPLQAKKGEEEEIQMKSGSTSSSKMPDAVQAKMENSFGTDFSGVNIHANSENASNIGALAYTQGSDIHFAPGQYNPQSQGGQELLGHELTHVVQQRQGNVQPTTQMKGVNVNDDKGLEAEADDAGKKASEGKSASVKGSAAGKQLKPVNKQTPAPVTDPGLFNTHEERLTILNQISANANQAFIAYQFALQNVKDDFNEDLKKEQELTVMLVELGFAFVPGVFGKLISSLVNNIPSKSPLIVYRLALMAQNPDIMGSMLTFAADKGKSAATEALTTQGKNEGEQFLNILFDARQEVTNNITNDVSSMIPQKADKFNTAIDNKILAYYALTHKDVANRPNYTQIIKDLLAKFKKEVMPLDTTYSNGSDFSSTEITTKLCYVRGKYAIVNYSSVIAPFYSKQKYDFVQWVSPEMLPFVKGKSGNKMVPPGSLIYGVPK